MIQAECEQTRELMDSYLSAELLVETNHEILRHLAACEACRLELCGRQRVRRLMKAALPGEDPPSELVRRISRIPGDAEPGGRGRTTSRVWSLLSRLGRRPDRNAIQMRGLAGGWMGRTLGGAAAGGLMILLLIVAPWRPAPLTASELLARSDQAARLVADRSDIVLHRSLQLEERRGKGGPVVARRRIEVWHNAASGITTRRAFDERSTLLAGEWRERNGARTVYRAGLPPQPGARPLDPARLTGLNDRDDSEAWRLDLSATEYASFIPVGTAAHVEDAPDRFVLTYEAPPGTGGVALVEATLTLHRATLHAIEQTVVVDRHGDVREYALSEAGFTTLSHEQVARAVFEPDTVLLGSVELTAPAPLPLPMSAPVPAPAAAVLARPSADSELEAVYRLHRVDAWLRDSPSVSRTPEGELIISAVVDTDERRGQLVAALSTVAALPGISIDISLDPSYSRGSGPPVPPADLRSMTLYAPLHTHFVEFIAARVPASQRPPADEQAGLVGHLVRSIATRTLDRSHGALRRAQILENLIDRFPLDEKSRLSPDAEATWQTMMRDHARGIAHRLEALRLELQPMLPLPWSIDAGPPVTAAATGDLSPSARQLTRLLTDIDSAVRHAFGPRTESVAPVKLADPAMWRAILEAEGLAAAFQRPLPLGGR